MRVDELIVEVRNPSLDRVGQIVPADLVDAVFLTRFNNVGAWKVQIPAGNELAELLRLPGYGIVVTGPGGRTIISGPTLTAKLEQTTNNLRGDWVIEGADDSIVLAERLAYPYPADDDVSTQIQAYDTRSGAAETVIKNYLDANIGPNAPAARQVETLQIQTDQGRGSTVSASARFDKLQELFYDLAQVGGIGYRFTQPGDSLEFVVYEPQDLSDTIRMDLENHKLSRTEYKYASARVTRAIVGGSGDGANRTFLERSNSDSLAAETAWNRRIEVFKDARQTDTTNELNTAGDEVLVDEGKTIVEMSVTPSDDVNMVYGVNWFLGDTVTVVANDVEASAVVTEIGISIQPDGVRIGATVGTPVGLEFESKMLAKQENHEQRISHLETTAEAGSGGGGGITEPVDSLQFDSTYTLGSDQVAELAWGQEHSTMEFKATDNVTVQIGQEQLIHVKNVSGSEIPDMRVVMFAGATGDHPTVDLAVSDGTNPPEYLVGITTEPIANEGMGFVTQFGFVNGVDTSVWPIGTLLYPDASNPGLLTSTKPSAPAWDVAIAAVTRQHASTGRILVRALPGLNVGDLHDMEITSVSNGELVVYNAVTGIWENQTLSEAGISAVGHTHSISDITGLQTALDGKANTIHTHIISDVTGLQTELDSKVDDTSGSATDLTVSGTTIVNGEIQYPAGNGSWRLRLQDGNGRVNYYWNSTTGVGTETFITAGDDAIRQRYHISPPQMELYGAESTGTAGDPITWSEFFHIGLGEDNPRFNGYNMVVADAIFKAYGVDNSNTNDSTTFTTRPVIATPTINVGTFTSTSDTITVPRAGIYECSFSFYFESAVQRSNVGVSWSINDVTQGEVSAGDYLRFASGHNEATTSMTTIYDLNANDQLQLRFAQLGNTGTVNLIGTKSVITVKRIG